jgi:hypothetical protein
MATIITFLAFYFEESKLATRGNFRGVQWEFNYTWMAFTILIVCELSLLWVKMLCLSWKVHNTNVSDGTWWSGFQHQDPHSQSGSSFGSVEVHSLTLSHIPGVWNVTPELHSLMHNFASPCLGCEPKARVVTMHNLQIASSTIKEVKNLANKRMATRTPDQV